MTCTSSTKPGNFWPNEYANKNRQQYHDVQKTAHARASVTCITCHSGHAPAAASAQLRVIADGTCRQCHTAAAQMYDQSPMAKKGVTCTNCHMAKIASRAGATRKEKEHWDVSSHTFSVVMPYIADSYRMRSSCEACHAGEAEVKYGQITVQRQNEVQKQIEEISRLIAKNPKAGNVLKARDSLDMVLLDGSLGAHNHQKAMELLSASSKALSGK